MQLWHCNMQHVTICTYAHVHIILCLISSFVTHKECTSQEALLIVYNNQWWVSQVIGTIATPTHCKEAIAVSFVHCSWKSGQEAEKAVVVGKRHQNFWTNRFQWNPHNAYVEISIESLMTPDFQHINEVCSSQLDNRQTDTQYDYHNPPTHASRVKLCFTYQLTLWKHFLAFAVIRMDLMETTINNCIECSAHVKIKFMHISGHPDWGGSWFSNVHIAPQIPLQ